ncbi:MAG: DNA topoisomerase I [Candidatus Bathyarchaeota archaeon]|nr:DNA topoisomerase I [Candidatus Bathyarchaeota archaeon]
MSNTLIICEKPSAAQHIAEALNSSKEVKKGIKYGMPYFRITTKDGDAIVCSAIGHFYQIAPKYRYNRRNYPIYDLAWKPKYLVERGKDRQKKWIKAIKEFADSSDIFIDACDYDIEGSLIGYSILKYACKNSDKRARRMKYSTLTKKELSESYENSNPTLNFFLINAGICRHELDWMYGINLSVALTESVRKYSKKYFTLSTGRVQGPTLKFIINREKEILTFVPLPYWIIKVLAEINGEVFELEYEVDKLKTKSSADEVVKQSRGQTGRIENLDQKNFHLYPPTPFDITSLQIEAYKHFRFSPRQTLNISQRLYLNALISYPRTSSQKLPASIGFSAILNKLSEMLEYRNHTKKILSLNKLSPYEGKKSDPAHPAIYPTGVIPSKKLEIKDKKLFDLIIRRFLATFGENGLKQSNKISIKEADNTFYLRGSRILKKGWIEYYEPYAKFEENLLPIFSVGEGVKFVRVKIEERYTKPPVRYNPSSMVKLMEGERIGTKTTRADILDILYRREYVKEDRIIATPLAFKINEILTKYCPSITEVSFTRELEDMMSNIELGEGKKEVVIIRAIEKLKEILGNLHEKEIEIGEELFDVIGKIKLANITLNKRCPQCNSVLYIIRSKKTKKRFIGCSGNKEKKCNFSLPLPQKGTLKLLDRYCKKCGFQLIQTKIRGRKPMIACSNCFINKERKLAVKQTTA